MGKQNNIVTCEILTLAMWFMEQKVIISRCRTDTRVELAQLEPVRPGHDAFDGVFLKWIKRYEL